MSCHPPHAIRPPSDPRSSVHPLKVADTCGRCHADATYMAGYDIPTDQLTKYRRSVHWTTMTAQGRPVGAHMQRLPRQPRRDSAGRRSVGNVCAQCHSVQGDLFARSRHREAFAAMGTPGCATCHSNHAIAPARDDDAGPERGRRRRLRDVPRRRRPRRQGGGGDASLDRSAARARTNASTALLTRAERSGMEVSQAQFDLNGATDALDQGARGRPRVHDRARCAPRRRAGSTSPRVRTRAANGRWPSSGSAAGGCSRRSS